MGQRYTDNDILELVRQGFTESGMRPAPDVFCLNKCCCGIAAAAWAVGIRHSCLRDIGSGLGRSLSWLFGFMAGWDDRAESWNSQAFTAGRQCGRAARLEHIEDN